MVLDIFYEMSYFLLRTYPITINQEDNLRRKGLRKNTPQYKYRNIHIVTR